MLDRDESGRSAIVVAALGRYLADRAAGCAGPVEHYASLFPGFEGVVAAELRAVAASAQGPGPSGDGGRDREGDRLAPGSIGPYCILGELGRGGMGMVLLAEQQAPVRRRVAIKVIKPGMDTRDVLRRFEAERQALAAMDHPNVARVFDAGSTATGRPYFVMDLVDGVPLTAYCDRRRLGVRARIELLLQVCAGVQHAHHRGIVHRDLKPQNVLVAEVDQAPLAKIIDFGLAKAVQSTDQQRTGLTLAGEVLGTPEYMSPEQATFEGGVVDTRSDVYALGVILYELLTGELPIGSNELRAAGPAEMERVLREREPVRPSARLLGLGERAAEVAAQRCATPSALARAVRGDLDRIATKALQKDPEQRYESAAALAADLGRHLRHEPVVATPPSRRYLLAKLLRRHRVAAAAISSVALALAVGLVLALVEMRRADGEARTANDSLSIAFAAIDRMLSRLGQSELADVPRMEPVRRGVLEDALRLHRELLALRPEDPTVRQEVAKSWMWVGKIQQQLGDIDESLQSRRTAVTQYAALCADYPERADFWGNAGYTRHELGLCLSDLDRPQEALAAYRGALGAFDAAVALDPDYVELGIARAGALRSIAVLHGRAGELEQAEAMARQARDEIALRVTDSSPPLHRYQLAEQNQLLALQLAGLGRAAAAEECNRAALEQFERLVADEPASRQYRGALARVRSNMGTRFHEQGRFDEALALGRAALEDRRRLLAEFPDTPDLKHDLGGSLNNVAMVLRALRQPADAYRMLEEAIELQEAALRSSPHHPSYRLFLHIHHREAARAALDLGRHRDAASHAEAFAAAGAAGDALTAAELIAKCVALVGHDDALGVAKRGELSAEYGARAVALLGPALEGGLDPNTLQGEGLQPLRGRDEFERLLARARR